MVARKSNGQFAKGVSGNPRGRAPKQKEQRYYEVMRRRVTLKDWQVIIDTAVARAKAGDKEARRFLAEYLMGKPEQVLNVQGDSDIRILIEYADVDIDAAETA